MYYCPHCGLSSIESHRDTVSCLRCGMTARYLPDLTFSSIRGDFPYRDMGEWYRAQEQFMHRLDLTPYYDTPMYTDRADFAEVIVYKKKKPLEKGVTLMLYGDRLLVKGEKTEMEFPFPEVTAMSVLGRNKLNIYVRDRIWQVKGDARFNPVKYMHTYYHYTNVQKGENHGEFEFLGL
jgi:hypothetical protein